MLYGNDVNRMIIKVADRLYFGDESLCSNSNEISIVHACKNPCFAKVVLSERCNSNLIYNRGHHLFLNMIDPDRPLFILRSFESFLQFVDIEIINMDVVIHCNKGESRSPSLALLYMAKRLNLLPTASYDSAATLFSNKFPYNPSRGIKIWMRNNWDKIK